MPSLAEFLATMEAEMVACILDRPVVSRLAITLVVALAATEANAQDTKSAQSDTPAIASTNGARPFLFDGRMPGDGVRQGQRAPVY
jgi:hypothetical protein